MGTPTLLIQNGKILENNLKKVKFDINDLLEECRGNGYFDLNEIDYAIMEVTIPHGDIELNAKIDLFEDLFNKKYNFKYKFVFIDENKWQKEKLEYINNLKSGYKYTLIEETKEKINSNIDISDVADIFDINKIEVE